ATPSTASSRPLTPRSAIANFSQAVQRAQAAGALDPPAAQDLLHRMDDLLKKIGDEHSEDAGHKVADLVHRIGDLRKSGQLSPAGWRLLRGPLADLEREIPPES